jgi:hypothetical protein
VSSNLEPVTDMTSDPGAPGLGGDDFIPPRQRSRFPTQAVILVLILAVGGAALYGMRRYGMQSGVQFDMGKTQDVKDTSEDARTYERIMADLAAIQKPLDVALTDFGKSPFMRDSGPNVTPNVSTMEPAPTDAERRKQEAFTALKAMHLNGIIGNIARIDELTVKAGDKIGANDLFTIKSVEGRTVTFVTADGDEFQLSMEVKKNQPGKNAPPPAGGNANRPRPPSDHR